MIGTPLAHGTSPTDYDTDDDGLSDRDEIIIHTTNPLLNDTDDDGLTDGQEIVIYTTNPKNNDTDGDTWLDGVEISFGTDPKNASDYPILVSEFGYVMETSLLVILTVFSLAILVKRRRKKK